MKMLLFKNTLWYILQEKFLSNKCSYEKFIFYFFVKSQNFLFFQIKHKFNLKQFPYDQ